MYGKVVFSWREDEASRICPKIFKHNMKKKTYRRTYVSWRIAWYSVVIWLLVFMVGGFVILPWFYFTLPIVILWVTMFYFRRAEIIRLLASKKVRGGGDKVFALGLGVSVVWFLVVMVLSTLEVAGFYYFNFGLYFSDPRNWLAFPLILLMPVVYGIILENRRFKHIRRKTKAGAHLHFFPLRHVRI